MSLWNTKELQMAIVTSSNLLNSALQALYGGEENNQNGIKYSIFYIPRAAFADGNLREQRGFRDLKSKASFFEKIVLAFEPSEDGEAEKAIFVKNFGEADYEELDTKNNELCKTIFKKPQEAAITLSAMRKQAEEEINREVNRKLQSRGQNINYNYRTFPLLMEIYQRQKAAGIAEAYQTEYVIHAQKKEDRQKRITLHSLDEKILTAEGKEITITKADKQKRILMPPKFYNTLDFLQDAEEKGISYHQVVTMLEMLYRSGLIPYYLTDGCGITPVLKDSVMDNAAIAFPTNDFFQYLHGLTKNLSLPEGCFAEKKEANGICLRHSEKASFFSIYDCAEDKDKEMLELLIRRQFAVYLPEAAAERLTYEAECESIGLTGTKDFLISPGWKKAYGESEEIPFEIYQDMKFEIVKIEQMPAAKCELASFSSLCKSLKLFCCGDTYEILRIFDALFNRAQSPWLITESGYFLINGEGKSFFDNFPVKPEAFSFSIMTFLWQLADDAASGKISENNFQKQLKEKASQLSEELENIFSRQQG